VPDQAKFAFTDCASRSFAKTFGAVGHSCLLLIYRSCLLAHVMNVGIPMHAAKTITIAGSIERKSSAGVQKAHEDDTKAYGALDLLPGIVEQ
jgi:hypothetical protein